MEDIKVNRISNHQCQQVYRVSKLIARQIRKRKVLLDMFYSRTRDLSLNKSRVAEHVIMLANQATRKS